MTLKKSVKPRVTDRVKDEINILSSEAEGSVDYELEVAVQKA